MQDSIAGAVVAALKTALGKSASPFQDKTSNIEAYNALLRGRYLANKDTTKDEELALASVQEAIRLDPRYAAAWAELAGIYNSLGIGGIMPPKQAYAEARKAVDQALAIDPNLAATHRALAALEWNYNRNFAVYQAENKRAIELDPNDRAGALHFEAFAALAYGHVGDAVRLFQQLSEMDPLNGWVLWMLHFSLLAADRLPEAEHVTRNRLELNPMADGVHCDLGEVLLRQHKPDSALAMMSQETDQDSRWCSADALWALGRGPEADALLAEASSKLAFSSAYRLARSYALRNDKDEAFKWLYRADENREPFATLMKADPLLSNLHSDPRFTALLRKMNLE